MFRIAAPGLTLGTIGCWGASRLLKSMVFGISAGNPLTFLAASGAVVAMAVLVAIIPIWGAARIDPIRHLHE